MQCDRYALQAHCETPRRLHSVFGRLSCFISRIGCARGGSAWIAHVGDSRAYRYRGGALERLTSDHSYVQEEIDAGRLTEQEAREHPRRNLITRSVGSREEVEVDVVATDLREGDAFHLHRGWAGTWEVVEDMRKFYVILP